MLLNLCINSRDAMEGGSEFPMESPVPVNECESQGQGSETILVIDDEEMIRQTAVQMLERRGFQTISAEDGEAGLAVYRDNQQQVDLVLLDHSMPRMSGLETLQALRQLAPEI
jgi:CheY-like chemotaxis protein